MSVHVGRPVFTCDRCGASEESKMSETNPTIPSVPQGWQQWMTLSDGGRFHLCPRCSGEPSDFLAPPPPRESHSVAEHGPTTYHPPHDGTIIRSDHVPEETR